MLPSTPPARDKEKRRFTRQSTRQAANIQIGDGEAIPAEILDFCQSGLFLAFQGEGTPDAAVSAMVGTPVFVEFVGAKGSSFRFKGRVARVSPGGLGIFVLAMPDAVLQSLNTLYTAAAPLKAVTSTAQSKPVSPSAQQPKATTPPSEAKAVAPSVAKPETPSSVQGLKQECENRYRDFLNAVMQDFFQRAVERLNDAGQEEFSFLERSRFQYGAQELTMRRSEIETRFFNAAREPSQAVSPSIDSLKNSEEKYKLSLVDEAEFEDWLSLSAVIKSVELDFAQVLDEFEQRYSQLVDQPIDRKTNPFGPELIGRVFQNSIQTVDFSNAIRAVLYKSLGQVISGQGLTFYQQLNAVLGEIKLPEPVAKNRTKSKATPSGGASASSETSVAPVFNAQQAADRLAQLDSGAVTVGAPTPESAEYSLDRILTALNQTQRRAGGASPGNQQAEQVRRVPRTVGAQSAERPAVLDLTDRLLQTTRQLVHPSGLSSGVHSGAEMPIADLRELLIVMDRLPQVEPGGSGVQPIVEQVSEYIAAAGVDARRLAPVHRQVLDNTSKLFARARADIAPESDMENLVRRLERPLLKLALQDPEFPRMPDHPARQVLNLVEQYAVAADDNGKIFDAKLQRFLFLLVDRVCRRADKDPGIYEVVRDNLEKVLLPILQIRRTRIARLQEGCEGRERIRTARSRVNEALELRLSGREVPGMVLRLLDAGWRQYLVLLELRHGMKSEVWEAGLDVLDQLLAWLGAEPVASSRTSAASGVLLAEVERALVTVNADANLLSAFMDELAGQLSDNPDTSLPGRAMIRVPPGRLAAEALDRASPNAAQKQLMDRLRVGDWWDLDVNGRRVPMQAIWSSEQSLLNAFTNRSASSKVELTRAELLRQIQSGQAKPGKDMDMPVIERSEHALFDETYQELMHQVLHDPNTGLLNRKAFIQRLALLGMPEQEDKTHTVGIIEFDQFRMIYNTCGVEATEQLTRNLAEVVREQVGPDALLASFRDDTLAILVPNCNRAAGCETIELMLEQVKGYAFQHAQHHFTLGFNIGVTEYSPAMIDASDAIRRADSACITAKTLGRNRMQIYEESSPELQNQEFLMDWAGRIDSYLMGNGLSLRCQQVIPLEQDAARLAYYEILLGIQDEDGQDINPMHFIPAVERLQRAHEVDIWVVSKVFEWITQNPEVFASIGGFAINLSATSLSSPEVIRYLKETLPQCAFPTSKITFEITETAAIGCYGAAQDFIRDIRRYGCKFALDDFGSGFTSYSHLKNLRTDSLKIDGSFVKDMLNNPGDYAMVKSMNDIGHSLGLRTVAEYVESPMILHALREIGVDYAQGYAVHKPCPIDELRRNV